MKELNNKGFHLFLAFFGIPVFLYIDLFLENIIRSVNCSILKEVLKVRSSYLAQSILKFVLLCACLFLLSYLASYKCITTFHLPSMDHNSCLNSPLFQLMYFSSGDFVLRLSNISMSILPSCKIILYSIPFPDAINFRYRWKTSFHYNHPEPFYLIKAFLFQA